MTRWHRTRRDGGAVLVLSALLMVALLTVVAFAIDLGFGRSDRRTSRALTDLAAVAAGYQMAGNADTDQFNPQADPVAACRAAVESVRDNTSNFDPPPAESDKCNQYATCDPVHALVSIVDQSSPWELTIEHPVQDSSIADANLGSDGLTNEDGEPCERMRVTLDHVRETFFVNVIGVSEVRTGGSAVVVGKIPDPNSRVVPAFLMLDRTGCQAISTNVGVGTQDSTSLLVGQGILVRVSGSGDDQQPGFLHTDSNASGCGNGTNDKAVYANEPSGGQHTMVVEPTSSGQPGVIEANAPPDLLGAGGTNVPVTYGEIVGRRPVDEVYQSAIEDLHLAAYSQVTSTSAPAGTPTNPVVTYGCNGPPAPLPPASGTWTAYVDCANFSGALPPFAAGASVVVFSGNATVGNSDIWELGVATTVTVRGKLQVDGILDLPSVENVYTRHRLAIGNNGVLAVNALLDETATVSATNPDCSGASGTARLVVFSPTGGPDQTRPALNGAGTVAMCATTVYLAGPSDTATYDEQTVVSPEPCSDEYPCPLDVGTRYEGARYSLSGNYIKWTAPNTFSAPLTPNLPLPVSGGMEDLALWAEGGGTTSQTRALIGGGNTLFEYSGVFFTPNAKVFLTSGNALTGPKDAQFIARQAQINGGRFEMQPSKQNTIHVPIRGSFQLIR